MLNFVHGLNYRYRMFALISVCIFMNVVGLFVSGISPKSLFLFDTIGTAVASLNSGLIAGLVVAISTAIIGSSWGDQYYILSGMVNCAGAIVWAVFPRRGKSLWGSELFDPALKRGYSRKFTSVLILGASAGFVTGLYSILIKLLIPLDGVITSDRIVTGFEGSRVGLNHRLVEKFISNQFHSWNELSGNIFSIVVDSIVFGTVDKIIITVSAAIIIFAMGSLPNYTEQRTEYIRQDHNSKIGIAGKQNSNIALYYPGRTRWVLLSIAFYVIFLIQFFLKVPAVNPLFFVNIIILAFGLFVVIAFDPFALKGFDRKSFQSQGGKSNLFYPWPGSMEMKFQRDVFEDILKLLSVLIIFVAFLFSKEKTLFSFFGYSPFLEIAATNALLLTAYRYIIVFTLRFSGRM